MTKSDYFENKNFYSLFSHVKSLPVVVSPYNGKTKFSIVIPTYGRAHLLKEAIDSCLKQDYAGIFEIVIIDNDPNPDNETASVISELPDPRISYYKNAENIGCLPNFNRCLEIAKSEYIIMLHTDDILDLNFLSTIIPLVEKNPDIDILIPGKRILRDDTISHQKGLAYLSRLLHLTNKAVKVTEKDFSFYNLTGGPIGILMKRNSCIESGGFNPELFPMSDYAFWVRMAKNYNTYYLPVELGTYRFFDNISSEDGMQESYIIHEFKLLSELITNKPYEDMMRSYLYEYVNYRAKTRYLDREKIFNSISGRDYQFNINNKLKYIAVIISLSFSYVFRFMFKSISI